MDNDVNIQQAALIAKPKGVSVYAADGTTVVATVRQFNMEEGLDPALAKDLQTIFGVLFGKLQELATSADFNGLLDALLPVLPIVKKHLQKCLDRPLAEIDIEYFPDVLQAFVLANFTERLRKSLAALGQQRTNRQATQNLSNSISATPSSSSSTTDMTAGGATPATSSSSGSGAA